MSTTFQVHPLLTYIPTYKQLIASANQHINSYLLDLGVKQNVKLSVSIKKAHDEIKFSLDDKAIWDDNSYAWFFIQGIPGGADSYFDRVSDIDKQIWKEERESNKRIQEFYFDIEKSIDIGYYWTFRRSMGQPAIINLSYGILAASLAELTHGFIYTDDGAWDYEYFPAWPKDFFQWYFKEDYTKTEKEWVKSCVSAILMETFT